MNAVVWVILLAVLAMPGIVAGVLTGSVWIALLVSGAFVIMVVGGFIVVLAKMMGKW